jgi:hypothetical protein
MTRWEALVRYDDEIREAATKLMPYGAIWVAKLGEAFFALKEDRKYLPNIVEGLIQQAELQIREAERLAVLDWLQTFSTTKEGTTSEHALGILVNARAAGYLLTKDKDGTILVSGNGGGTFHLRSNADIVRFATLSKLQT